MNNYNDNQIFGADVVENTGTHAISKKFMATVFLWMFIALGVSAAVALYINLNLEVLNYLFNLETGKPNLLGWAVMFAPLGFVMLMGMGYTRLSAPVITVLFLVFAAIMGITVGVVVQQYTSTSVLGCFLASAAMFGSMAIAGYRTNQDLTKFGSILMMGAIGIFVASLINIFMQSDTMSYVISFIGVMVFTGLTAYDVQKLKRIGAGIEFNGVAATETKKLAIMGALNLYLDFINIFLFLLRLFGGRKD